MATEINVAVKEVIKNNRTPLSNFAGAVFANDLFKPQVRVMDPDYQQKIDGVKAAGNGDLILNRSPRRFGIYGITITSLAMGTNVAGDVVLVINKGTDDEIEVPYTCESEFAKTDADAVREAIKSPDKNSVFSDAKKLAGMINQLNKLEIDRIDSLIKQLEKAKQQCESAISNVNDKVSTYLQQKAKSAQKTGNVEVETNISIE